MHRLALAAALAVSFNAFADEETPQPAPTFAAEAIQLRVEVKPDGGIDWAEITFKISRCVAGPCFTHQVVKVLTPLNTWRGKHGQTLGIVKYAWKDKKGEGRAWALAMRLDDADENDRFVRESDSAVAEVGPSKPGVTAVASR
ncbi:MAG: hypothetical protein JNK82_33245 [Myxococcaceae bacterium]|nr:hypothetical protein [Myxococcaceae bacterium]